MMNDYVMINVLLPFGTMVAAAIIKSDAERLLKQHAEGKLDTTVGSHNIRCRQDVQGFSVRGCDILGMYVTPATPIQQQQYTPQYNPLTGLIRS